MTRIALVTLVSAAAATFGLYGSQRHQFQHHNDRVVRRLASASTIRIQFHPKQSSLDGFTATGVLFPRIDPTTETVAFDGRLSYEFLGQEYNFTMIDNRGYTTIENVATRELVRNDCLHSEAVPPLGLLMDSLRHARVVDAATHHNVTCTDGKLVEFLFANEPYVFCSRANGEIDKVHGGDIDATLEMLPSDTSANTPSLESLRRRPGAQALESCDVLDQHRPTPSQRHLHETRHSLMTRARDVATVLTGRRRLADSDDCSKTCKDGKKKCLFVHGLGKKVDGPLVDKYDKAWGKAARKDMNCCTETKFVQMDTMGNPWYTDLLANKVCDAAKQMTNSSDPMQLENIAIISHSMGNLIVANAAMKNICAVGPTSKWIALAGPISGSKSANLGTGVCSPNEPPKIAILNETVVEALTAVDLCPAKRGTKSLVYRATELGSPELDLLYNRAIAAVKERATSALCGVSSPGLASLTSAKWIAVGLASGHGSPSDGAVEINSCAVAFGADKFQTSWRGGRFYKASINHGDAVLRNGDGWFGDSRKPVKWLNCQF